MTISKKNSFNCMGDFAISRGDPVNHIHEQIFLPWDDNLDISIIKLGDPIHDSIYEVGIRHEGGGWEILKYRMSSLKDLFSVFNKMADDGMIERNIC